VYDSTGKFLRNISRGGKGPGEVGQSGTDMAVTSDTILLHDSGRGRVHRFSLDGRELGGFEVAGNVTLTRGWVEHPQGGVVQQLTGTIKTDDSTYVRPPEHLLWIHPSGAPADTIFTLPSSHAMEPPDSARERTQRESKGSSRGGGEDMAAYRAGGAPEAAPKFRIFAPEPMWTIAADGSISYAMSSEYVIRMHDPAGALRRVLRRGYNTRRVTDADTARLMRLVREQLAGQGVPPGYVSDVLEGFTFAENFPAMVRLLAGPANTLWVQRVREQLDLDRMGVEFGLHEFGSPRWDVFSADGTFLGDVNLPDHFAPLRWVEGKLIGILLDPDEVQHVVILRLRNGEAGLRTSAG
jgi:hypothetical protein